MTKSQDLYVLRGHSGGETIGVFATLGLAQHFANSREGTALEWKLFTGHGHMWKATARTDLEYVIEQSPYYIA